MGSTSINVVLVVWVDWKLGSMLQLVVILLSVGVILVIVVKKIFFWGYQVG